MPKRIATPPLADNTNYFTVYFPYPLNANWELKADQKTFARWIACILPIQYLSAIMYKPSARGMVLVEIDREFIDHRVLLGEHKWSEFLKRPTDEEKPCSTMIFYSTYSNHRGAQKDGWLTIHVQDSWFDEWSPNNRIIQNPYPPTHWCTPPAEDRTNKPMCRPLPVQHFPPPPKAPKPVVGSTQWIASNAAPNQHSPELQRSAWSNGSNSAPANTSGNHKAATKVWGPQRPATVTAPAPSVAKSPQGAWGKKPATASPKSGAWGTNKPAQSQHPLGVSTPTNVPPAPPGLVRSPQNSGSSSSTSSSLERASEAAADIVIHSSTQYNELSDSTGKMTISDSMEQRLFGIAADDVDHENYAAFEFPHMGAVTTVGYQARSESIKEDLWADVKTEPVEEDEELCPTHGVLCTKGICKDKSDLVRKKEQREREAKLRASGSGKKGRGTKGVGWRNGNRRDDDGFARKGRRDADSASSSATGGSRSVSRTNSTPQAAVDHDDEADPWDQF